MKSVKPKDGPGGGHDKPPAQGGGRNAEAAFHSQKRSNDTHASTTDPDARLYRKGQGKETRLWVIGHGLMENPCVAARAHGLDYRSNDYSFGLFDDMVAYLERVLAQRPYAAGERFTAADTQLASAIGYTLNVLKVLPERPVFAAYLARIADRPAYRRYQEKDREAAMRVPHFQKMFPDGPPAI